MMESITSFRFESHKIRAFSEEGQGDDVQKKIKKTKRKELVGEKKNKLNFCHLELVFLKISPLVRETGQDFVQAGGEKSLEQS